MRADKLAPLLYFKFNLEAKMIRKAIATDLAAVVDIYNETIASRMVTADLTPVSYQERQAWFDGHTDLRPLFVYQSGSEILGWVSFKTFYGRPAYQGTVEISIYVASHARGQGIAKQLLDYAEHYAQTIAVNVFLAFIFSHNIPSITFFSRYGFANWGQLPEIANMDGTLCSLTILGKKLINTNS